MLTQSILDVLKQADDVLKDDPKLLKMFKQCFVSTIDTTLKEINDHETFVITGDIPAMWLRDSSAQVNHYLPFIKEDQKLASLIAGLIHKQMQCILLDPYANAFNQTPVYQKEYYDCTDMNPMIWERKYEVDSLCYPVRLAYQYYQNSGKKDIFTPTFLKAMHKIVDTFILEQNHEQSTYRFERPIARDWKREETETLKRHGKGLPVNETGMTWSAFRPSDDACRFNYLIPANMFASVILEYIKEFAKDIYQDDLLYEKAYQLKWDIDYGIQCYAIYHHQKFGDMYAYETDGFGNYCLMDDANVPSLLSLPYLGYCSKDDPLYQHTRQFVLSSENPYYYEGTCACGIGSPHTPTNYIWHIALSMQGLTGHRDEAIRMIHTIMNKDNQECLTHEGFDKDNPENYTRPWFAWSNSLFAELVYQTYFLHK